MLEEKMNQAFSEEMEFEKAIEYRDLIIEASTRYPSARRSRMRTGQRMKDCDMHSRSTMRTIR